MACPYVEYRTSDGDLSFDHERPYCTVVGSFVAPMRADMCNDEGELHHEESCEFFREAEGLD